MGRIRIDFPTRTVFETSVEVRITDLNYGGHAGNDTYLRYLQEARSQLVRHWGYASETDLGGIGLIMADAALNYRAESFYGDALSIEVGVQDITRVGFDLVYRLTNLKTKGEVLIAKTGMVCYDYGARKVIAIPPSLKEKLTPEPNE